MIAMFRCLRAVLLCLALLPAAARAQDSTVASEGFTLGPGDVVRVKIWREKALDGEFQVDETGRLTLPLLGTQRVTGIPWAQLHDSLLAAYRKELKAPAVTLIPLRRVYVLGEVTKPGLYLADPTLSLTGIVALAGGANPQGDLRKVRLVRDGKVVANESSLGGDQTTVRSGDQVFVDQRGWFDRNSTFVASAAISLASIIITFVRR